MNGRGNFSFKKRLRIYLRDAFSCRYCDRAMNPLSDDLSLDHIDPDGGDEDSNLVTSCISCNARKGSRTPEAWALSAPRRRRGAQQEPDPAQILEQVARRNGLKVSALSAPDRTAFFVTARAEAARRLRDECGLSLKHIGRLLGGRDHSTIIHLLKKSEPTYPLVEGTHVDAGPSGVDETAAYHAVRDMSSSLSTPALADVECGVERANG